MANDHHVTINMSNIPSISASSSNSRLHGNGGAETNDGHHSGSNSDRSNDSHNNRYSSSSANESNLSAYTEDRLSRATTTEDEDSAHRHHNTHSKLVRDHHKVRFFFFGA